MPRPSTEPPAEHSATSRATAVPAAPELPISGLLDLTLLVVPGLIWGASFLFIAEGLEALAPDGVTFVRFVIGFVALSFIPAARRPVARSDRLRVVWLGILWLAFPMAMFPHAEQHVSSALTGMLNAATPLFAVAVASLVARKLPTRAVLVGLAVGAAGTVLMAIPGLGAGAGSAAGIGMIVAALASYGVALNLARPLQQRNGALPVVWSALGVAVVLFAPIGAPALAHAHWSPAPVLSLLALGALGTGLANVVMATAAGRVGATRASATIFLIPVVAFVLGVAVRGEHVAALSLAGGAVCLAGAWLVRRAVIAEQRA
jgi:drug/metabolite transporter (DMT)-like permease